MLHTNPTKKVKDKIKTAQIHMLTHMYL